MSNTYEEANTVANEREAFEAWAKEHGYQGDELAKSKAGLAPPGYFNLNTETAWKAWQARAVLTAAPQAQHSDDVAVDRFAAEMKAKLAAARAKGRGGWEDCPPEVLSRMLREHADKGDPRDVANFCMFLWCLGYPIEAEPAAHEPFEDLISDWAHGDALDAERWRELLRFVGGHYSPTQGVWFSVTHLKAIPGTNITDGRVEDHFTKAVDAAITDRAAQESP